MKRKQSKLKTFYVYDVKCPQCGKEYDPIVADMKLEQMKHIPYFCRVCNSIAEHTLIEIGTMVEEA